MGDKQIPVLIYIKVCFVIDQNVIICLLKRNQLRVARQLLPRSPRMELEVARPRKRSGPRERSGTSSTTWCYSTRPHTTSCTMKCPRTSSSPPVSSQKG